LTKEQALKRLSFNLSESIPATVNFFDEALQQVIVHFVYRQQIDSRKKEKVGS